jgi:signal transduction histidine kinase
MRIISLLLVFTVVITVQAQKAGRALVDSLYSRLEVQRTDSARARVLAWISYESRHIDPNEGLKPGLDALMLARRSGSAPHEGMAHFALSLNYNYLSKIPEAIEHAQLADSIFSALKMTELLTATVFGLAQTYMAFDTAASRQCMLRAKALLSKNREPRWIIWNTGSLGNSYKNLDRYDSARKYINLHLSMAEKAGMSWQVMMARNRIGAICMAEDKHDSAYLMLLEAMNYFETVGATQMVGNNASALARVCMNRLDSAKGEERKRIISEGIKFAGKALEAGKKIGFVAPMYASSRLLSRLYALQGDTGKAYRYQEESIPLGDLVYGANMISKAAGLSSRYERMLKDQQLEVLRLRSRQQWIFNILSGAGLMVLIVVVLLIVNSRRKLSRAYLVVKEQKDEITRVLAQLESTNQELEAFSYSVSHDLRAPVRRTEALARMLLEDYSSMLDEEGKNLLDKVSGSAKSMNELIENLLKLSRITRHSVAKTSCNLSLMAEKIFDDLKQSDPSRDVNCLIQEGIIVNADPHLMGIVMQNLLDNAWKYTGRTSGAEITVGWETDAGKTSVFVKDNGVGFEMSNAGRLFTPFQRLHSDEDFKGTGIGLATVKRILVKHGGSISVQSEPGKGTKFSFTLD